MQFLSIYEIFQNTYFIEHLQTASFLFHKKYWLENNFEKIKLI